MELEIVREEKTMPLLSQRHHFFMTHATLFLIKPAAVFFQNELYYQKGTGK